MTPTKKIEMLECTCTRCGHIWQSRQPQPPQHCPKCNSPYWNKAKKKKCEKKVDE